MITENVREFGTQVVDKRLVLSEIGKTLDEVSAAITISRVRLYCRPDKGVTLLSVSCRAPVYDTATYDCKHAIETWVTRYMRGKQSYGACKLKLYRYEGPEETRSIATGKATTEYAFLFQVLFAHSITQPRLFTD
jgi:hypothetical protein